MITLSTMLVVNVDLDQEMPLVSREVLYHIIIIYIYIIMLSRRCINFHIRPFFKINKKLRSLRKYAHPRITPVLRVNVYSDDNFVNNACCCSNALNKLVYSISNRSERKDSNSISFVKSCLRRL